MTSGGIDRRPGAEPTATRSRTSLVIDQLLSRVRVLVPSASRSASAADTDDGDRPADPWPATAAVLRDTTTSLLTWHLTWLTARRERGEDLPSERTRRQDQVHILGHVLDDRGENEAVHRARALLITADDVTDTNEAAITYAAELVAVTSGQPEDSPYLALADSATEAAAELLFQRGAVAAPRPSR